MESLNEESNGVAVLHRNDDYAIDDSDVYSVDETGIIPDAWSALESGLFGDFADGQLVEFCSDEEDMASPSESSEALVHASIGHFPDNRKGRLGLGSSMVEEFETVGEQIAYLLIQDRVRNCFVQSASKNERKEAIEWVFTPLPDEFNRTFLQCCDALGVRSWMLQTRIQYQFYKNGIVFDDLMPAETVAMPETTQSEASYYGGDEGYVVAHMAWLKPGISHQEIATTKQAVAALYTMAEKGIMCEYGGCWYTTGRNPLLVRDGEKARSWVALWAKD